jgi:hypothetical protein
MVDIALGDEQEMRGPELTVCLVVIKYNTTGAKGLFASGNIDRAGLCIKVSIQSVMKLLKMTSTIQE